MEEKLKIKIFDKIQKCLNNLVGSNGHLASYSMDKNCFKITDIRKLNENETQYSFSVNAYYESEFAVYSEDEPALQYPIDGKIVLDNNLDYVREKSGNIKLEPWKCIDPEKFR